MLEQDIQDLTCAIQDLIAVLRARPLLVEAAPPEPEPAVQVDATPKVTAVAEGPKRRGRPPKNAPVPAAETEESIPAEEVVQTQQPEADDFSESTEVIEEVVTVDTVRAAIRDIIIAGGKDREDITRKHIVRILAAHNNAKTLPELPPEVYPKVLAAIRAIPV